MNWWAWGPVQSHYHEGNPVVEKSKVGKICWKGRIWAWSKSVKWWMMRAWMMRDGLTSGWGGESRQNWWGWRNESGIWFQRLGDAYLNERSMIFKEEIVGGRERVTTDEDRVLRGGWREIRLWIARISGCKNFVSKKEKFIFDAFVTFDHLTKFSWVSFYRVFLKCDSPEVTPVTAFITR